MEYVYGVVPAPAAQPQDGAGSVPVPPPGIDGTDVRLLAVGEFGALVSTLDGTRYAADLVGQLGSDPEWMAPRAVAHDAVVTWASDNGPIVPLPMWVMFADPDSVVAAIQARTDEIRAQLELVRGSREYGVRLRAGLDSLTALATSMDAELSALAGRAAAATPGQAYLLRRKLEETRREALRRVAGQIASEVHLALEAESRRAVRRPIDRGGDAPGAQANLLLDGAYLVPDATYDSFRRVLTRLVERFASAGCSIEFTGPWPPYHFVGREES